MDSEGLYEGFLDAPSIDETEENAGGSSIHTGMDILSAVNYSDPGSIKQAHNKLMAMSKVKVTENGKVGRQLHCCYCPRPTLQQRHLEGIFVVIIVVIVVVIRAKVEDLQHYIVTCQLKLHRSRRHRCLGGNRLTPPRVTSPECCFLSSSLGLLLGSKAPVASRHKSPPLPPLPFWEATLLSRLLTSHLQARCIGACYTLGTNL